VTGDENDVAAKEEMHMKRTRLGVAALAVLATSGPALADEFIYGSWFGVNHSVNTKGLAPYFDLLREKSGGEIDWDLVPGAQLASGPGTPEAVATGLMDAGIAIAPYQPRMLPNTNFVFSHSLPGDDALAATGAMNETILLGCPGCQQEYRDNNAVGFGGYSTTPYKFMCREMVDEVADLEGLKVRASGGGVKISEIAGATPVSMSPAEATTALERGTLDCVLGAVSWLRSYGYMDVVESVVDSPMGMGGPPLLMFVNRDSWGAMTPEMRAMHLELAPDLVAGTAFDGQVQYDAGVVEAAKEAGVTFTEGGDDFAEVMATHDKNQREHNLAAAEEAGATDAQAVLDYYTAAYERWQGLLDEKGRDRDSFRELLWQEVFSKVDPEAL
jgi:TRAP-type C4-dicarboxylate transport system substrate-binding protein